MFNYEVRADQKKHDQMVCAIVGALYEQNYSDIRADLQNFAKPEKITNCIPDVSAIKNSHLYLYEIETSDTIDIEHTRKQWKEFSDYAAKYSNVTFTVVIPDGYEYLAKTVLNQLSANALIIEL